MSEKTPLQGKLMRMNSLSRWYNLVLRVPLRRWRLRMARRLILLLVFVLKRTHQYRRNERKEIALRSTHVTRVVMLTMRLLVILIMVQFLVLSGWMHSRTGHVFRVAPVRTRLVKSKL